MGTIKTLRNVYCIGTRSYVHFLLQSACTSMCCQKYDWNIFDCDVIQKRLISIQVLYVFLQIHIIRIGIIYLLFEYILYFCLRGNSFHSFSTTRACTGHCLVSHNIIKLWQNSDLCCAFIDVYHIYNILMTSYSICTVSTTCFCFNKRDIGHLLCILLVFVLSGQQILFIWAIIDSRSWRQWQHFNAETCSHCTLCWYR